MQSLHRKTGKVDLSKFNFKLLINNKFTISEFGNTVDMYAGIVDYYIMLLIEMDTQAGSLIKQLNEEYELE